MRRVLLRGLPILWMALIFALSSQPELPTPRVAFLDTVSQIAFHFGEYAVLATLLLVALLGSLRSLTSSLRRSAWIVALLVSVAYAVSDEYHQSFVPGRTASWIDLAVDGLGAVSAVAILGMLGRRGGNRASGDEERR